MHKIKCEDLSPGERLIMEVLAARWRLNESLWAFDNDQQRWLKSLEGKGLISIMHGAVENTKRASLTEAGKQCYWDYCGEVPTRGETGSKTSTTITDLVPKEWIFSKDKDKKKLAIAIHGTSISL